MTEAKDHFAGLDDDLNTVINAPARTETRVPADFKPVLERAFTENCPKCGGDGQYRAPSSRGHRCFKCNGTGKLTFKTSPEHRAGMRAKAQAKKVAKIAAKQQERAEQAAAFLAANQDIAQWLDQAGDFGFAVSMRSALAQWGSLTANQAAACRRLAEKRAQATTERAARENNAQTVNAEALEAAFAKAAASSKRVALWIGSVRIAPAKPGSKWEGSLYVVDRGTDSYLGRVTAGKFVPSRDGSAREAEMLAILQDPKAAAVKHGKLTGSCSVCNRTLTDADSVAAGIGPICATRMGW